MSRPFLRGAFAAAAILFCASLAAAADLPWNGAPFAADPKALLAAAEAVKPKAQDEGVVVLLDETHVTLDAKGLATRTERLVYRVVDESAVDYWSSIDVTWQPWYEEEPKVEARVVSKDGSVHPLDPKSFGKGDQEDEPDMFSDTRELSGPLPAVAPGAVIEQVVTYRAKAVLNEAGTSYRHNFGRWVESQQDRFILDYPTALPLHLVNQSAPAIEPRRSESNGITHLVFESGTLPARKDYESGMPSDNDRGSYVAYATGRSWQDVARWYVSVVEKQIGPQPSLGSLVASAVGDAKDPREIAARLLAKVERDIRYAGVEFGEGSIVPRTPAETLSHKYGDCKDKAILLVALLRQAGVPAHAALLDSGYGRDVNAALPAVNDFNHVIVYVPGERPFWVDPTDEFARAGELPSADQGRRALIAANDTTTLVTTPLDEPSANRTIETRTFTLAESGKATVVETSEFSGEAERDTRRRYAGMDQKSLREHFETYVKNVFLAEALGKYEIGDVHDLSKPFRVTVEAVRAARGTTAEGEAAVAVFHAHCVNQMPEELKEAPEEAEGEPSASSKAKKREHDYVNYQPHVLDVHYRVQPPPGYVVRPVAKNETLTLGTSTLTKTFSEQSDGTFAADYHFDSGPRRITPAQYEATREAISKVANESAVLLMWDQLGRKLMDQGEVGKAIAEFRRMAIAHPKEAIHHLDIAKALITAGFGTAARAEAKRAVEIEPKSAKAHLALGWTLSYDLIGRPAAKGWDLEGARAAYKKAKELDPKDIEVRSEYALLLKYNAAGVQYGEGARLDDSIAEYLSLKKEKERVNAPAIDRELMLLYLYSNRFKELKELAAETKDTEKKDALSLAAVAVLEGGTAAVKASEALELSKRRTAQTQAGGVLMLTRRYPQAVELLAAAAQGAPNAAELRTQLDVVRKMKRVEEIPSNDNDPADVLRRFFAATAMQKDESALREFMSADVLTFFDDDTPFDEPARHTARLGAASLRKARGATPDRAFLADAAVAVFQIQQQGNDETGYRLLGRGRAGDKAPVEMTAFVVRENGKYRVAAIHAAPEMIALRAFRLAESGKLDAARQWLDWTRDYVHGSGDDPVASSPFATLWNGQKDATADDIRLAAASFLTGTKKTAGLSLPVLLAERAKATDDRQLQIDQALASIYETTEKWSDLLTVADRLQAKYPRSARAFEKGVRALLKLNRTDEAKQRVVARLQQMPNDRAALRALGRLAESRGDYAEAIEAFRKVVAAPDPTANDYNQFAWTSLFGAGDLDAAIEDARRADGLDPSAYPILNTLATLYAEQGKSAEARQTLLKSLEASATGEVNAADWYIVGRLAENYGITDAAVDAYQRVPKPAGDGHGSSYELAQKRLAGLRK